MNLPNFYTDVEIDEYDLQRYIEENAEAISEFLGIGNKENVKSLFQRFEDDNYRLTKIANGLDKKSLDRDDVKSLVSKYESLKSKILDLLR